MGEISKRGGRLIGVDLPKLQAEVNGSLEYLLEASGYRPEGFSARTKAAA